MQAARKTVVLDRRRQGPGRDAQQALAATPAGPAPSRWSLRAIQATFPWWEDLTLGGVWRALERLDLRLRSSVVQQFSPDPAYRDKEAHLLACLREAATHPDEVVALFLDEAGYTRWPDPAPDWAPAAPVARPVADRAGRKQQLWRLIGALNALTGQVDYRDNYIVGREQVSVFYRQLEQANAHARRVYVIQDNWSIHSHPDVLATLATLPRLEPVWLPTDSPWLNPIEKLWRWLKGDVLKGHRLAADWPALRLQVRHFLDQFASGSDALLQYVGLAGTGTLATACTVAEHDSRSCSSKLIRSGRVDEDEIARFLEGTYSGLVAGLERWPNGHIAAEDAVQEALVRAWERAARGEPLDSPSGWVARVAANLLRDQWRRAQAEARALERLVLEQPGLLEGLPPPMSVPDPSAAALTEQIAVLPLRQRHVVVLHYYAGLSVQEVAHRLGVGEGTVKRSLFRARRALQRALGGCPTGATAGTKVRARSGAPAPPPRAAATADNAERRNIVKGWYMSGSHPRDYMHEIAGDETHADTRVASVRSVTEAPAGFGTLMQMIAAREYLGQRIRFSAAMRTAGVDGWVGLWLRVDGPEHGRSLAFDNMQGRSISGTTDWRRYEVVLDVAEEARAIGLGVLLHGAGEVRVADFRFEPVSEDVPTTGAAHPAHPQNLDLAED